MILPFLRSMIPYLSRRGDPSWSPAATNTSLSLNHNHPYDMLEYITINLIQHLSFRTGSHIGIPELVKENNTCQQLLGASQNHKPKKNIHCLCSRHSYSR